MKSPTQGAATSGHVASATDLGSVSGGFFVNREPRRSDERSYDEAAAAQLWNVSADLAGLASRSHEPRLA